MDSLKKYENATVEEIEAKIEEDVNRRDAMNEELLALNAMRDVKVRTARREKAAAAFEAEHGVPPPQVVSPGSAVAAPQVKGPGLFSGILGQLFGKRG